MTGKLDFRCRPEAIKLTSVISLEGVPNKRIGFQSQAVSAVDWGQVVLPRFGRPGLASSKEAPNTKLKGLLQPSPGQRPGY